MKIKVVEVVVNGETKYLGEGDPSIFNSGALVDNPTAARNFLVAPPNGNPWIEYNIDEAIDHVMGILRLPNDAWYARSGMLVEAVYTVEFEIKLAEVDRKIGRLPRPEENK